jgi:predicted alpha/beta superfamily hydrolase
VGFVDLGRLHPIGLGTRHVRAYVPPGPARARPILVMFDGQNVYGDTGSFAGGWHVNAAVDKFPKTRAPIIVAVDHGGLARIDELTPFSDGRRGGKLDATLGTFVDELMPRVRARFDTTACFIGGASLGGLAALYAHLTRPDVFAGAMAMSPSLWFTRGKLARYLLSRPRPARSRIYLDIGTREGGGKTWPIVESFGERLAARGWTDDGDLRLMVRPDARGKHDETAWRRRFPKALRFLLAA